MNPNVIYDFGLARMDDRLRTARFSPIEQDRRLREALGRVLVRFGERMMPDPEPIPAVPARNPC